MTPSEILDAVRALHRQVTVTRWRTPTGDYTYAQQECQEDEQLWRCRTVSAIDVSSDHTVALALLAVLHQRAGWCKRRCSQCREPWPCRTAELLDLVDAGK